MMAIAQGVAGLGKTVMGGIQQSKGQRQVDDLMASQPQFDTPESTQQMVDLYGQYLSEVQRREGMPGQERMEANIKESAQSGISNIRETARSSTQALGATTDILSKQMDSIEELEIEGARRQARQELQATQMYGNALGNQAQYEQQAFQYNEFMPWQTELAQANALRQGGQSNLTSGLSDMLSGATQAAMSGAFSGEEGSGGENDQDSESGDRSVGENFMYQYWIDQYLG